MRSRTRSVALVVLVAGLLATACTGGGNPAPSRTRTATPSGSSPPTGPVRFQPGEYRYDFEGVTASLAFDGSQATLDVQNASGADLAPPALYVIDATGDRHDGTVTDAAPIADGASATFHVTFPDVVTEKTVGLVILLFGDSNYGAFAPAPAA